MAATDHPLKQLFSRYVGDLISWLLGCPIQSAVLLSPKLSPPTADTEADQIYKVTLADGRIIIVHIEFQGPSTRDPMHLREVNYLARTALTYQGIPIISIVIYIGKGTGRDDPGSHTIPGLDGTTTLAWSYHIVRIWDMPAEDLLRVAQSRPAVVPLIGLTHIRDPRRIMPQVVQIIAGIPDHATQKIILDLVFKLLDSKEAYMILEETLLADPMFENSPYVQRMREIKNEGIQEGERRMLQRMHEIKNEGMQEGMKQGIQEGIQEGERRMLQRMLERRFGDLPPVLLERLAQVSASQVESLVDVALRADTLDAFAAHLEGIGDRD